MTAPDADGLESNLIEHLIELRARLMRALMGLGAVMLVLLPFAKTLYEKLAWPMVKQLPVAQNMQMIATDPTSGFFAPMKLVFFASLFLTMPWLLYQAWAFVAPGLYRNEKRLALPLLVSSLTLFYLGCAFAFFVVLPSVFHALRAFTPDVVTVAPDPAKYLDFVLVIFFAFGASFELPVALVILTLLGIVSPKQLAEWRGYAIVGIFAIAAVITPPDAISQLLLAVPMCLLYELGIVASKLVARKAVVKADTVD